MLQRVRVILLQLDHFLIALLLRVSAGIQTANDEVLTAEELPGPQSFLK